MFPIQKAFIRIYYGLSHAIGAENTRINKPHFLLSNYAEARHTNRLHYPVVEPCSEEVCLVYL